MENLELQKLLTERMQTMPNKARRVTEYLLSHMREASYLSIGAIAEQLNVSKAQLVRVAQNLGFKGYSELKTAIQDCVLEQINPSALLARAQHSDNSVEESIYHAELANIEDTMKQITDKDVDYFCDLLSKANNIYCVGWGISSLVMEMLQLRLTVMGCKATLFRRGGLTLWEQMRCVRKGDVVITCELPSYTVEVSEAIEIAVQNSAKIVTISDSPAAPVCRSANLSFFVSASSPTFGSSIIGPLFLTHILTSALAISLGETAKQALDKQAEFLHDERIFHPIFGLKY